VTPFHHLSGDSHINRSLRAGPITASRSLGRCAHHAGGYSDLIGAPRARLAEVG
jgi:hypothetical protein